MLRESLYITFMNNKVEAALESRQIGGREGHQDQNPKSLDSGSSRVEVRGFNSRPPHQFTIRDGDYWVACSSASNTSSWFLI
jgi:hypothetical protein